ncbi:MAG TPA: hypothetical protein PK562_05545 [Candidatus Omnitrophota bacterium]|nr:hypothetical protein [Candidatus Omnitrophota bacterium]
MRTLAVLLCLSVVIMAAAPAWCHAPSDISIAITGSDVNVTVSHPVGDPQTHFVKVIRISVNDAPFASQDFTQQTGNVQKANFTIPDLKKGGYRYGRGCLLQVRVADPFAGCRVMSHG